MRWHTYIAWAIPLVASHVHAADFELRDQTIAKISFGSCSKHDRDQPVWPLVMKYDPDLWIWLGDAIYADQKMYPFVWEPTPLEHMQEKWDLQKIKPGYKQLIDSRTQVLGTWDDHDYGQNDGGHEYSNKSTSQTQFLNFLDEPEDSVRWQREGVYASYAYGTGDRRVLVILLDVRYHFIRGIDTIDDADLIIDDVLGADQWKWLELQLQDPAPVKLIGSGIQVIANTILADVWRRHRASFVKLQALLGDTQSRGVVFMSGDVHFSELSCCGDEKCAAVGYPLYDLTSSGLTHACFDGWTKGEVCETALRWLTWASYRIGEVHGVENYAKISIDWDRGELSMGTYDMGDRVLTDATIRIADLVPGSSQGKVLNGCPVDRMHYWLNERFRFVLAAVGTSLAVFIVLFIMLLTKCIRNTFCGSCYDKEGTPRFKVYVDPRERAESVLGEDTEEEAYSDYKRIDEKKKKN